MAAVVNFKTRTVESVRSSHTGPRKTCRRGANSEIKAVAAVEDESVLFHRVELAGGVDTRPGTAS